jgi:hypothetical protein
MLAIMPDPYIDQYETVAYGKFAVGQILSLVVGLDSDADSFVKTTASRLLSDTESMWTALSKVGSLEIVTYSAEDSAAIVDRSKATLRRLVAYADSRVNGDAIMHDILQGDTMTVILRRRPVKLAAALEHALSAIKKHQASLPEHATWSQTVADAHAALVALNGSVRKARTDRRSMTPEVEVARSTWLKRYSATKLIIRGILEPLGKGDMMPEIFDDLAEVHRAQGVYDDDTPAEAPAQSG